MIEGASVTINEELVTLMERIEKTKAKILDAEASLFESS